MKRHLTLEKATPRFPDSILKLSAKELSEKIQNKTLNMLDVVTYFSKYTHEHGRNEEKVNAITEEIYDDAYSQAEKLLSGHTKDESKHLYGVPISVKECYSIKGCFSTGGMACRLRKRRGHDSLIIELLKNAGAIPLCLGNVVQTMMLSECVNNIWGRSRNPWDLTRTPGGSSGGDAALVAMKCVPLAVGGDVAGSIRIPAASCGVVGFKPTSTRLSHKGNMRPRLVRYTGFDSVQFCISFLWTSFAFLNFYHLSERSSRHIHYHSIHYRTLGSDS
jgi:fatty acid amide hydrolase